MTTQFQEMVKQSVEQGTLDKSVFQEILLSMDREASKKETVAVRDSRASRVAAWKQDLEQIPMEKIEDLDQTMSTFVEKYVIERVEAEEPRELNREEIDQLAGLYVDYQKIKDLLDAKHEEIRSLIFGHLDIISPVQEETPPSQIPGSVVSETHSIKFSREGGKRKAPSIDWDKLKEELGEEEFERLACKTEIIPAHVSVTPSEEVLLNSVQSGDINLETLRESLKPGDWSTPRFVTRKVK